ncbi:MAG: diguanylate cyclase domain-containing protein [Bacillota bacterium]
MLVALNSATDICLETRYWRGFLILRQNISKKRILGRFGGEEFVFIFKDTDKQQSLKILKRIH